MLVVQTSLMKLDRKQVYRHTYIYWVFLDAVNCFIVWTTECIGKIKTVKLNNTQ